MVKLPNISLLVLDTETTGFVPRVHRVIEYACAKVEGGKVVQEYEQLLSIPGDVPPPVAVMTQIATKDLQGKPAFSEVMPTIAAMLADDAIVVGQNVRFDIGMLKGEGWDLSARPWIDTSMLASIVFPELKSYSLGYLSTVLDLTHEPRHRALGDVRATLELLGRCWERLCEIPKNEREHIASVAARSPNGYRKLFEALEGEPVGKKRPKWLATRKVDGSSMLRDSPGREPVSHDVISLIEESLDPTFVLEHMRPSSPGKQRFVAVKNIEAWVRRFGVPEHSCVLYPPEFVLLPCARDTFLAQQQFTEDECTLAIKLKLYDPVIRSDIPLHGDEHAVWQGKLACARADAAYVGQIDPKRKTVILDHQELLRLAEEGSPLIAEGSELVIDDASMLEDTATHAYGWHCPITALRAASQGDATLTKFVDLLELWVEKTRGGIDLKYLTAGDLHTRESAGLRDQLDAVLAGPIGSRLRQYLEHAKLILDPKNVANRIVWLEVFQDGSRHLKSVPEDIAVVLKERLFGSRPTILLIPPGSAKKLGSIVAIGSKTSVTPLADPSAHAPGIGFPDPAPLPKLFGSPPSGKTVVLLASRRMIEDAYVRNMAMLEEKGVTLICQGFSGGQGRMQAEFAAAKGTAMLVVTPWTYETMELPAGTVDRLILHTLPFDHPSHAVLSRRSAKLRDPFNDYALPRLMHRLFRLLRTFCKHRSDNGSVSVLDERLKTKAYGKDVRRYLESLCKKATAEDVGETSQMNLL